MVGDKKQKPFAIFDSTFQEFMRLGREEERYYLEAFFLYNFYCIQAKKQDTHNIYCTIPWTRELTGMSERGLDGARKLLKKMQLIGDYVYNKQYKKRFFTVKVDTLITVEQKFEGRSVPQGRGTECTYNSPTNNNSPVNNTINERVSAKPSSRLIKKEVPKDFVIPEPERPNLADKNGNAKPERRKDKPELDFDLSERNRICIEYWNSKQELVSHRIESSLTIKKACEFLNHFFSGVLINKANVPRNLDRKLWKHGKLTEEDFRYYVDELVYCINQPDLLPKVNGHKISLLDFLYGNDRNSTDSALFNFCVGDYKTIEVNIHPKTVEVLKVYWKENIGKFEYNAENETAFVVISNLVHDVVGRKKVVNKDWKPSMYSSDPAVVVKTILEKNMWIKEKKHTPEYMNTKFFKGMIKRYDYDVKSGQVSF